MLLNLRSVSTVRDNHWFIFTVSSNSGYSKVAFISGSISIAAGHSIEVYTDLSDGSTKKESEEEILNEQDYFLYYHI